MTVGLLSFAGLFNNRRVQLNAAANAYDIYLNNFLGAGRWNNVSAAGNFDVTQLDANGFPTSVPSGGAQVNITVPASANVANWILLWDGSGTMGSSGSLVSGSYSTSGCVISFGPNASPITVQIQVISVTTPGSNYPHNIRLVRNNGSDQASLVAGNIFQPLYLTTVGYAGIIRTLDLMQVNGGTQCFWADRKPTGYYTYNTHYWPPGKIVPIANVTWDGVSKYTVAWSGQNGALTDKTQFIAQVPTGTSSASTTNLNATGDIVNHFMDGTVGTVTLTAGRWVLFTYDAELNAWLIDTTGGSSGTGISNGAPPEIMVALANAVRAHVWFPAYMYACDVTTNTISDYFTNLATYCKNTLKFGLQGIFECGPNENWNSGFAGTQYAWNKMNVKNGGLSAYTVTGATSGSTTTLTIGTNTTQVGSLLVSAAIGGLSGASGNCRVLSKPNGTQVVVNLNSTGSYTSGGTLTPVTFDNNNWYGLVASNIGQAVAAVYGIGNINKTYRTICAFQAFGGANALGSNSGTNQRLQSAFLTTAGGSAASNWVSGISCANYFDSGYGDSAVQSTIKELQLAFEYTGATPTRQAAILEDLAGSCQIALFPVTISAVTPGNPTVLTVDRTDLFLAGDSGAKTDHIWITGTTGNIGAVLNANNLTVLSKTGTTVTVSVNTTGLTYSGGGTAGTISTQGGALNNAYANVYPAFLLYTSTYSLEFMPYEGGQSADLMLQDSAANIQGVTLGSPTVLNVGANAWDYLYNTVGLSGLTTAIAGIAAGTLATLLNGNTYTITAATATTVTITIDTTGKSAWVSGGTASYVGSQTKANVIRSLINFTPTAQTNTVDNYNRWIALDPACKFPSEYTLIGQNFGMITPDLFSISPSSYRYFGMQSWS